MSNFRQHNMSRIELGHPTFPIFSRRNSVAIWFLDPHPQLIAVGLVVFQGTGQEDHRFETTFWENKHLTHTASGVYPRFWSASKVVAYCYH
jgi:hypothetical protein